MTVFIRRILDKEERRLRKEKNLMNGVQEYMDIQYDVRTQLMEEAFSDD